MFKNAIILVLAVTVCLLVFALVSNGDTIPQDIVTESLEHIEAVVEQFEDQLTDAGISKESVNEAIEQIKEYNESAEYIVVVEVQNVSMPILNTTLCLPADDTVYNSVNVGETLTEEQLAVFNVPAEYLTGWKVTIVDKKPK